MNQLQSSLINRIKDGMEQDNTAKTPIKFAPEGKTRCFWVESGLLFTIDNRRYLPRHGNQMKEIIKECYDSHWVGHPGVARILTLLQNTYYWQQMKDNMESYMRTCLICQQDKVNQHHPMGLLEPLPIVERPWQSVSMDFIMALPKSEGFGSIMVVINCLSKYATFIPVNTDCTTEEAVGAFLKNVVKLWRIRLRPTVRKTFLNLAVQANRYQPQLFY